MSRPGLRGQSGPVQKRVFQHRIPDQHVAGQRRLCAGGDRPTNRRSDADQLLGHYKIGFGYDSRRSTRAFPARCRPRPGSPSREVGNTQFWVLVDQMLVRQGSGRPGRHHRAGRIRPQQADQLGLSPNSISLGAIDRGFWPARPQDAVGLLFNYNTMSGTLGEVQASS